MDSNLRKCIDSLAKDNYIVEHKGRYLFTSKFNKEISGLEIGIQTIENPVVKEAEKKPNYLMEYLDLIDKAVPRTSDNGRGALYQINLATAPGRKAYIKAREEGETFESLLAATKAYYSQSKSFLVKVEKFFVDELWRNSLNKGGLNGELQLRLL